MKWASAIASGDDFVAALEAANEEVAEALGDAPVDLVVAFVASEYADRYGALGQLVGERFPGACIVGCSAGGVIGGGRELERQPALSITAARLPGVELTPFHLAPGDIAGGGEPLSDLIAVDPDDEPDFILLPDPFTCDIERLIAGLELSFPDATTLGGVASGGQAPGSTALFLDDTVQSAGVVGLALSGNIVVDTIVAQGCRPVGQPMFATRVDRNLLLELDGQPATDALQALLAEASPAQQVQLASSLCIGLAMRSHEESYHQGDYLVRNLLGVDTDEQVLAVGALLEENGVVQFHLRDAAASHEDLQRMLARYRDTQSAVPNPKGALLFACLGRGELLYGVGDHDTHAFVEHLGPIPLGGFFCNGEIGPVGQHTFLHGYTSAFGVFGQRTS